MKFIMYKKTGYYKKLLKIKKIRYKEKRMTPTVEIYVADICLTPTYNPKIVNEIRNKVR